MSELYLIAHKVRGEPAFDVAQRMACPECRQLEWCENIAVGESNQGCAECDQQGFWWIIPTSGHRAYPIMHWDLASMEYGIYEGPSVIDEAGPLAAHPDWAALPDHYTTHAAPSRPSLTALLPKAPVYRRF